jgi:hypothetical protein
LASSKENRSTGVSPRTNRIFRPRCYLRHFLHNFRLDDVGKFFADRHSRAA